MDKTLEEAAREAIHAHYDCNGKHPCGQRDYCEHCNGHNTAFDCNECCADEFNEGFIAGAKWQAKKSPWINVNERLPNDKEKIFVLSRMNISGNYFVYEDSYDDKEWAVSSAAHYTRVAWMPIPSFDEILEANKDVLERIKKKGD